MTKPEILLTGPTLDMVARQIDENFIVHKMWEASDVDALIADVGARIMGIVTMGHMPVDRALIDRLPGLKVISNFGVGYDTVDAAYAGEKGIIVGNTPDVLTEEVADTATGLLLMTVRQLSQTERYLRSGRWTSEGNFPLTVGTMRDRTVGIIGLGRIGKAIARRIQAMDVKVVYHGRSQQSDVDMPYYASLMEMARDVDTLMIVVPGGAATRHMINADVLKALGSRGVVINVGRGSAIDETALIAALQDGTIQSAGLDVFEHEPKVPQALIDMEHVVLMPHVGSASIHTRDAMGQLVVDNLMSCKNGTPPITPVPETPFNGW